MNLRNWGRLGHADNDSEFDLGTNIVIMASGKEGDSRTPSPDAHLRIVHESGHWNRFHGSSVGVTLSLMKYASERIIVDHFAALEHSEKIALIGERKTGRKIFDFADPRPGRSERFTLVRQLWLDLLAARWALYDLHALHSTQWDFSAAVGSALTDVLIWGEPLFSTETALLGRRAPLVRLADEDSFGKAAVNGKELTTRHILECASTIDELLSLGLDDIGNSSGSEVGQVIRSMGWPFADDRLAELARDRLADGEYGWPLQAYSSITGDTRFPESAMMTLLLCDVALNPPLPPFLDLDESAEMRWLDIYPPVRFLRCCQAAGKLGALSGLPSDGLLLEYSGDLCHAAQITDPRDMGGLFTGNPIANTREARFSFPGPGVGTLEGDYITFLSWAQRKLWEIRRESPTLLTFFGANSRSQVRAAADYITAGGQGTGWFMEPFQSYQGTYRTALDGKESNQYLASLALYLSLHDLVSASEADSRDWLPANLRDYRFWRDGKAAIEELVGCAI
jgi:hypothetical protein